MLLFAGHGAARALPYDAGMFNRLNQMKQMASLMGQLGSPEKMRELRERAERMQADLAQRQVIGEAGGGAARVTMNGRFKVTDLTLDPAVIAALAKGDDAATHQPMIEKLIVDATNDAMAKAQAMVKEEMAKLTEGVDLGELGGLGGMLGAGG